MKQWVISGVCVLLIYNFTLIANISYQKMHVAYEKTYNVLVRLSDRIEQLPDYEKCKKIAVIGCLPGSEDISVDLPPDMTGITDGYIIRKQDTEMAENVTQIMLKDYCELDYENTTEQEIEELKKTEAFHTMKNWPEESAVRIIDDTLVIKFGKEEIKNE